MSWIVAKTSDYGYIRELAIPLMQLLLLPVSTVQHSSGNVPRDKFTLQLHIKHLSVDETGLIVEQSLLPTWSHAIVHANRFSSIH